MNISVHTFKVYFKTCNHGLSHATTSTSQCEMSSCRMQCVKECKAIFAALVLSSHNLPRNWARELFNPSKNSKVF